MPYYVAMRYLECIEPLKAEETLVGLNVSAYPHSNKGYRNRYEKHLKRAIKGYNQSQDEAPADTKELYYHLMRTLGNGR